MRFSVDANIMAQALAAAGKAVGTAEAGTAGFQITAKDNNSVVIQAASAREAIGVIVEAEVETAGQARVSDEAIAKTTKKLRGALTVSVEDDGAAPTLTMVDDLSNARIEYALDTNEAKMIEPPKGDRIHADGETLSAALSSIGKASAKPNTSGEIFESVHLTRSSNGAVEIVATDSFRIHAGTVPTTGPDDDEVTLPAVTLPGYAVATVTSLFKTGPVAIQVGEERIAFSNASTTYTTLLLHGQFPGYQGLVGAPLGENVLTADSSVLVNALEIIEATQKDVEKLSISLGDEVTLRLVTNAGEGAAVVGASVTLDASYEGEELEIGIQPKFLREAAQSLNAAVVKFHVAEALKPCVIVSGDEDANSGDIRLVMPTRLDTPK